ncbi:MAG: hypothetical protein ACTTKF_04685 [Bacteroides sp.]
MIVFQQKIDELSRSLEQISQLLEDAKKDRERIIEISDNATEKANTIVTKEKEISELLTQSETTKTEIESVRDELKRVASAIQEDYTESSKAKSQTITHREEVQEFVEEIQGHQDAIEKQAEQFKRFEAVLEQNKIEQKQYLDDALKLINESKQALSYTTSVGLSTSFDTQCKALRGWKGSKLWSWLVAAVIAIIGVICIGIWLITEHHQPINGDTSAIWIQIVGKISMIPLLVTATIFCAKQYGKQKRLLEDYSYKLVLARSMVAFSEELKDKDPDKHKEYLSMVLHEILQDPLRYRVDPNANKNADLAKIGLDGVLKIVEKALKLSKGISNS